MTNRPRRVCAASRQPLLGQNSSISAPFAYRKLALIENAAYFLSGIPIPNHLLGQKKLKRRFDPLQVVQQLFRKRTVGRHRLAGFHGIDCRGDITAGGREKGLAAGARRISGTFEVGYFKGASRGLHHYRSEFSPGFSEIAESLEVGFRVIARATP